MAGRRLSAGHASVLSGICQSVESIGITSPGTRRNTARRYSFIVEGVRIRVCQEFFLCTLNKKRTPWNKISTQSIAFVKKHIQLFPVVSSDYTRNILYGNIWNNCAIS